VPTEVTVAEKPAAVKPAWISAAEPLRIRTPSVAAVKF